MRQNKIENILNEFYAQREVEGESDAGDSLDHAKQALYKEIMECIGEDQKPIMEGWGSENASLAEYGAHVNYLRNNLRSQIRKSIDELFSLQDKGKE